MTVVDKSAITNMLQKKILFDLTRKVLEFVAGEM